MEEPIEREIVFMGEAETQPETGNKAIDLVISEKVTDGLRTRAETALNMLFTVDSSERRVLAPDAPDALIVIGGGGDLALAYYEAYFRSHGVDLRTAIPVLSVMAGTDLTTKFGEEKPEINTDHLSYDWFASLDEGDDARKAYRKWLTDNPRAQKIAADLAAELTKHENIITILTGGRSPLKILLWDDQKFSGATADIAVPHLVRRAVEEISPGAELQIEKAFLMVGSAWKDKIIEDSFPEIKNENVHRFLRKLMSGFITVNEVTTEISTWEQVLALGQRYSATQNPAEILGERYAHEAIINLPKVLRKKLSEFGEMTE